jgi:hypothetical protein
MIGAVMATPSILASSKASIFAETAEMSTGPSLPRVASARTCNVEVTGVVRERMDAMAEMGRRMKSITNRVRSKDMLASVPDDANVIKVLAAKIIPLFPQGSMQPPTDATPAI